MLYTRRMSILLFYVYSIATAVENASCIICFMTPQFQQSDYCKLELQYAKKRNIPIIPLKLVENWEPSSWLGIILLCILLINNTNLHYRWLRPHNSWFNTYKYLQDALFWRKSQRIIRSHMCRNWSSIVCTIFI